MVAVDDKYILARRLLECTQFRRYGLVILYIFLARIGKVARDENIVAALVGGALSEERVNDEAALGLHGGTSVGIPIYLVVNIALQLLPGVQIVEVGGDGYPEPVIQGKGR